MWCCYRFRFDVPARQDAPRDLSGAAGAFAESIMLHFHGAASWTAASARARDGSVEIWFGLPQLPTHPEFDPFWRAQLRSFGLSGERVPNRN